MRGRRSSDIMKYGHIETVRRQSPRELEETTYKPPPNSSQKLSRPRASPPAEPARQHTRMGGGFGTWALAVQPKLKPLAGQWRGAKRRAPEARGLAKKTPGSRTSATAETGAFGLTSRNFRDHERITVTVLTR